MANIINGTAGADALNGLSGDNVISGGAGSDKLNGGAGLDTLDGGSGSDTVSGNSGDDLLIYRMTENIGSNDVYDGGSGKDVLQLNLTLAQWNSAAVQSDIAKYLNFLTLNTNVHTEEATNAIFQFSAFGLAASKIEFLQVIVDGAALSPEDNPVLLTADSMGAGENTAGAGGNILGNDTVADQVAGFSFTQAAHGSVSMVTDFSVVNAPVATPTYTPAAGYWDYLAVGETATDSFTYTVTDADGDTATTTVTVAIAGANDPVTITSGPQAGAVVEDAPSTPSPTDSLNASGTVAFSDVDLSDGHTATAAAAAANTTHLGSFTLSPVSEAPNAATGSVGWTYALNNAAAQYLAAGQVVTETYVVTVDDGHGSTATQNVVVTITGTNDAPTITAQDLVGGVTEQVIPAGNLSDHGTITFADVDLTDVHLVSAVGTPVGSVLGALTAVKDTDTTGTGTGGQLTWTYTVADSAVEYLAKDQTKVESFTITLDDQHGGLITKQIDVTITGTNDAPVITSGVQAGAVVEDAPSTPSPTDSLNAAGTVAFSDVDLSDDHTATFAAAAGNTTHLGTFALGAVSEAANAATGSVGWTYTLDNAAAQYLAKDQVVTETYVVTVDDGHGSTATQNVTVTITGTNDAPTITAQDLVGGVTEQVTPAGNLTDHGTIGFADVDLTDVHSVSVTPVGSPLGTLTAVKDTDTTGTGTGGQLTWTYTVADSAVEYLAKDQTKAETFTVKLDDGNGGVITRDVVVTITGTNDAPTITAQDLVGGVTEQVTPAGNLTDHGTIGFADVDLTDVHSVSVTPVGSPLGTLTAVKDTDTTGTGTGGQLTWTYTVADSAVEYLAKDQTKVETFTVTLDDGNGGVTTRDVVVTITGTNDAPVITSPAQAGAVVEDAPSTPSPTDSLTAAGTVTFSDVDLSDNHTATAAAAATNTTHLGTFALGAVSETPNAATGSVGWTYTLDNTAAQYLAQGQTVSETYVVTINDGLATTTQNVVVTITGTNDAPVISLVGTDSAAAGLTETNAGLVANGHVTVTDVDLTDVDTLSVDSVSIGAASTGSTSVSAAALKAMMSVDQTGAWHFNSGSEAFDSLAAGQTLVLNYVLKADDGLANVTQTVAVTITGTNDAPVISLVGTDSATAGLTETNAGLATNGHVTVTDVDAGDVATLSVTGVTIDAASTGTTALTPAALQAMMSVDQTGAWHFNSGSEAFNNLAAGQTLVLDYVLTANDGDATDTQTVAVTITGTNDAPVAAALIDRNSDEDTAFSFTAPASTDVDSASLTYTATLGNGAALPSWIHFDAATRTFSGTPPQDFNGVVAVKMITSDGSLTDSATFNLTINPVNDAPVAVADTLSATEDTPVTYTPAQLLANDTDVDNPNSDLHIASVTSGTGGTAVLNANGSVTFTPNANFNGAADFTYTTTDGSLASAPATVTVNVAAVNDPPVAVADTLSATEDTPVTYTANQLLANDTDVDSPTLHISSVTSGTGGTAVLNLDGTVTFTPSANFNGPASFTYTANDGALDSTPATVTVNVAAVNDPPVFTSGATGSVAENAPISTVVYDANVTDVDGGPAVFSLSGTDAGLFNINASTGEVTFKVSPNFEAPTDAGADNVYNFSVNAFDGTDTTSQAVAVTVANVNEAPVIDSDGGGDTATRSVPENTTAVTTVHATDPDAGTTLAYSIVGGADQAKFAINSATGALSFITAPDFEAPTDADHNNSYIVQVRASDGSLTDDQTLTVNVTDVVEDTQGPTSIGFTLATAGATTETGGVLLASDAIGTFVAKGDPNSVTFHYALSGADAGKFALDTTTGALSVGAVALGAQATPYAITISALDQANNSVSEDVKVWVGGSGGQTLVGVGTNVDFQYGLNGNDTLSGGAGDDALIGGQNNDLLIGGAGADQLFGGAGTDAFRFTGLGDAGDRILDFQTTGGNADTVQLSVPGFSLQTPAAVAFVDDTAATIAGANIIRWTGPVASMDTPGEINTFLAGKAGTFAGGVFVLAYDQATGHVALYYDDHANNAASTVTEITTFDNLTSTSTFTASDFLFV